MVSQALPLYRRAKLLFFLKQPATPVSYPLSLHDALPISLDQSLAALPVLDPDLRHGTGKRGLRIFNRPVEVRLEWKDRKSTRMKLQPRGHTACRLLIEKKKRTPRREDRLQQRSRKLPLDI